MKEIAFEKFANMINKKAWDVSKKTGVDFEELKAQGALIYCKTLENYDVGKSSFSTILYLSLNQLYEYAYYFRDGNYLAKTNEGKSKVKVEALTEVVEKAIESYEINPSLKEFLELAKEKLGEDSYKLIEWLVNRTWEFQGRIKPCLSMAMKNFGWSRNYCNVVWAECKKFWNESGWTIYC